MPAPNRKGWLAVLFILLCLAIPFGITYYVSTDTFKAKFAGWQAPVPQAQDGAGLDGPRQTSNQVTLVKNKRMRIHNTSLVFKGIDNNQVVLDLYLEDLDPGYAYPQRFACEAQRVIRLGDVAYTVKGVSQNALVLNIHQMMGAR